MARLKLAAGVQQSDAGLAVYKLAEGALSGGNLTQLEQDVRDKFVSPPHIEFVYDESDKVYIAVPDLSIFGPGIPGTQGQAKFGNEALGFVVMFGCGP
jgi:hypothetical protein